MIGFITVRADSSRLSQKCFLPFGSSKTLIEHIITRALHFGIDPIVTTTTEPIDDAIERICTSMNVPFYRGPVDNKMLRWLEAASKFKVDYFHTVDADDPFFDGYRMIDSINSLIHNELDFVGPSEISASGVGSEGYSIKTDFLRRTLNNVDVNCDTEMIHDFLQAGNSSIMENDVHWKKFPFLPRLTLDYMEDYVLMSFLAEKLGNNVSNNELFNFLKSNEVLIELNAKCAAKWKQKQNNKSNIKLHK